MSYVGPNGSIHPSYNVACMKNTTVGTRIWQYDGENSNFLATYYIWTNGLYWTRNTTDAKNIIGRSEQYMTDLSYFDLRFEDREFSIYAPPTFTEVVYISDEDEGECRENCYPLRIGKPETIDEKLYTFTMIPDN